MIALYSLTPTNSGTKSSAKYVSNSCNFSREFREWVTLLAMKQKEEVVGCSF